MTDLIDRSRTPRIYRAGADDPRTGQWLIDFPAFAVGPFPNECAAHDAIAATLGEAQHRAWFPDFYLLEHATCFGCGAWRVGYMLKMFAARALYCPECLAALAAKIPAPFPEVNEGGVALFTLGYAEPDALARLDAFMARDDAALVDIRLRPTSRWCPDFRQPALIARYGMMRYAHCIDLGNVNCALKDAPIILRSPADGVRRVVRVLEHGRAVVLLCACKDYERCHRKVAFDLIMAAMSAAEK